MTSHTLLGLIPLFEPLKQAERRRLAELLRRQTIRKGETLFRRGDEGTALYIITSGRIRITLPSSRDDEITVTVFSNGDFFGEMALLDGMPRSADAVALEETHLYVLNRSDFITFLINNESAVKSILYALSMRLRKTDNLLGETVFLNVSMRLKRRLADLAEIQGVRGKDGKEVAIHITQKELASLVGVSRESVNKELKVFERSGLVETSRNTIIIRDMEKIRAQS
jgi:CRP/FNR family transcriptional regulator, cyclic AMP receptor protein